MEAPRDIERLLLERAWLRRVALALVHDEDRADDLTQATYAAALERAPEHVEKPRSWLGTVARNLWRNDARERKRREARERAHGVRADAVPATSALVERAEQVERLGRLLLALGEPYRTTLLLRYFEDLPPREVADRMGVPVETVRTRVKRALAELAQGLDAEPGGRRAWAPALLAWAQAPEVAALGTLAGAVLMKKLLVGAAAVLLLVGGWGFSQGWFDRGAPDGLPGGELATGDRPAADARADAPQLAGTPSEPRGQPETVLGMLALSGRVVDVDGRPVAGVPVRVRPPLDRWFMPFPAAPPLDKDPPERAVLAEARSGADGAFTLTGLTHGVRYEVEAVGAAPRFGSSLVFLAWPWTEHHFVLRVGDGVPVRGRVVDLAGAGVPAWVEGSEPLGTSRANHFIGRWHAVYLRTDADGRFEFGALPPGSVLLSAFAPGRGARRAVPVGVPASGEVLLRLEEPDGAELVGHVRDETGKPVVGARLAVESHARPAVSVPETVIVAATTDAEGAYRARGLIAGRVQDVHVEAPGYFVPGMLGYDTLLGSGIATLDIVLLRSVTIEGQVLDEANRPVAGALVHAWPKFPTGDRRGGLGHSMGFGHEWTVTAGAAGRFRIDALPRLPVMLEAELAGHLPARTEWLHPTPAGTMPDALVVLKPVALGSQTVRGYARRADGSPVPGTMAYAMPVMRGSVWTRQVAPALTLCAADGAFMFEYLDPTCDWSVGAKAAGFTSPAVGVAADGKGPPVELRLEPRADPPPALPPLDEPPIPSERLEARPTSVRGPTVEVVLLDPEGQAAHSGQVWFRTGRRVDDMGRGSGTGVRTGGAGARAGGGKFWTELRPGEKSFDVEVVTLFDVAGRRMNVRPQTFSDLDPAKSPFTFRLETGRVLRGRVLNSAGRGVPEVRLMITTADRFEDALRMRGWAGVDVDTDAEGAFELSGLPEGELVVGTGPIVGFVEPMPVTVRPEATDVVVQLDRGVGLSGRVVDPDGKPVIGAFVRARIPRDTRGEEPRRIAPSYAEGGWGGQTDAKGAFAFTGIPTDARLQVSVDATSGWLPAAAADVASGRDDVVLQVTAGAFVEGEIVGEGWEEAEPWVILRKPGDPRTALRSAHTVLAHGMRAFRLGPVAPGDYVVAVQARGEDLAVAEGIQAPASGVRLTLPPARHIDVRIVGENVKGFSVVVFFEDTNVGTSVDETGRLRLLNARPGRVTVVAHRDGDERYGLREDVDPTAGPVEVLLQQGLAIAGRITGLPAGEPATLEVRVDGLRVRKRIDGLAGHRFRVVGLPPGTYEVSVECRVGRRFAHLKAESVAAGGPEVVLEYTAR